MSLTEIRQRLRLSVVAANRPSAETVLVKRSDLRDMLNQFNRLEEQVNDLRKASHACICPEGGQP